VTGSGTNVLSDIPTAKEGNSRMKNIYLTILPVSTGVRDLLRLGMVDELLSLSDEVRVILVTPAHTVPEFHEEFAGPRVVIRAHSMFEGFPGRRLPQAVLNACMAIQRKASGRRLMRLVSRIQTWLMALDEDKIAGLFTEFPPSLVVSSHPLMISDWRLFYAAKRRRIPTLAIVRSWDNILKGLKILPDFLAVWNEINRKEAMDRYGYTENEVIVTGSPPFDRYFLPGTLQPRDAYLSAAGLNPGRPVIVYATLGQFHYAYDETFLLDLLLKLADEHDELAEAQIVCRLHPMSQIRYFWKYTTNPRVTLSFPKTYDKTIGWSMTVEEADDSANLLCHADVVITPTSTMMLEAPIFDTPTILPIFSTVQPELAERYFGGLALKQHCKPLAEKEWLPFVRSEQELADALLQAIRDPELGREGRLAVVEEYVPFRDGKCGERVARLILDLMRSNQSSA